MLWVLIRLDGRIETIGTIGKVERLSGHAVASEK